jgi:hypothetical protein
MARLPGSQIFTTEASEYLNANSLAILSLGGCLAGAAVGTIAVSLGTILEEMGL